MTVNRVGVSAFQYPLSLRIS